MLQLRLIQQRKQMTKTSVVSSMENKQPVVMTISLTTNQVHVVSLQRNGTLRQIRVQNVRRLKHQLNSRSVSTNHTSRVLEMETLPRHTSSIVSHHQLSLPQTLPSLPKSSRSALKCSTVHHFLSVVTPSNVSTETVRLSTPVRQRHQTLVRKISMSKTLLKDVAVSMHTVVILSLMR